MNVIITGSTKGIGFAMARRFLQFGDKVVISSRNEANLKKALEILQAEFPEGEIYGAICDVRNKESVNALGTFAMDKFNILDIWINNAGTKGPETKPLLEMSEAALRIPLETNILGVFLGTQAALRIMIPQNHGKIFNMEGLGSNGMASPNSSAYGASKATIPQFLKTIIKETQETKVLINNISPGMVLTDLLLKDSEVSNQKIFNILAEKPDTVADFLVTHMRKMNRRGKRIKFLTTAKATSRFLTAWRFKERWFDKNGIPKF